MKGLALFLASIWGDASTDQERCVAEAKWMAEHRWFAHCGATIGRFEGVEKERQMRNYHGQSKHAMKIVGDMVTGKLAIRLGTLVKAKQLTPEQNEQMMDELMEWDRQVRDGNKDAEKPEWFEYV